MTHLLRPAQERLLQTNGLPKVFQRQGLGLQGCVELELGLDESGNLLIPIRRNKGELIGLEGRYLKPDIDKYLEISAENKNPPWLAPDFAVGQPGFGVYRRRT